MAQSYPAQPLSIQWIDLKKVDITSQLHSESSLVTAIENIIKKHNEQRKDENNDEGYVLDNEFTGKDYSFKYYSYTKISTSVIAKQSQCSPKETKTNSFLVFLYRHQPSARIIALTSRSAWLVVRPYIDYSFPVKVAEKVCNPKKIIQITRRCLFKSDAHESLVRPYECELYKTLNLYYLVESFKCDIKDNSKLFKVIQSKIKKHKKRETDNKKSRIKNNNIKGKKKPDFGLDRYWIQVTTGLLRIGRRLRIQKDYPDILNLFATYMEGKSTTIDDTEEKKDPAFEFLHWLHPVQLKKKFDKLFIERIFSLYKQKKEIVNVHVRHKHLEDFLCSHSFEIEIGSSHIQEIGSKPPTIEQIIGEIPNTTEQEFTQAVQESKLRFTNQASELCEEKIIDCLEGELCVEDNVYFKIRKMWYVLEWDYLALLHDDFIKVIKNVLIEKNTEWWLPRSWAGNSKGEKEETYNRSYASDKGYLVFDQICPDNIELCDILKYTNDALYLYHVKEEFGQHTRDACSQILNAATVIRSAITVHQSPNYLEKLWSQATTLPENPKDWKKYLKTKLDHLGKEAFIKIFHDLKIVFVYAYLPSQKQSLSNMLKASEEEMKEELKNKLTNSSYLDSYGRLTGTFFSTNQKDFVLEGEDKNSNRSIYKKLKARQFSKSTLAKIELTHLARNLQNLNFEFKICEISRSNLH